MGLKRIKWDIFSVKGKISDQWQDKELDEEKMEK